jgi:hypothetical protein
MSERVPAIPVRFDVPMPEVEYGYVPILYPRAGQRVKLVATSTVLTSCMTHWIDDRTRPCYAPFVPCPGCSAGFARGWKGFLGGVCCYTSKIVIVMLTAHACRPWVSRLRGEAPGMRGYLLTVWHEGGGRAGKTRLAFSESPHTGPLPDPLDVEAQLKHMWAVTAARTPLENDRRWESIPVPGW